MDSSPGALRLPQAHGAPSPAAGTANRDFGCPAPPAKRRHICEMGTGEVIHIVGYRACPEKIDEFEVAIQGLARCIYSLTAAVTDVRVCHPQCGEVVFVITFITKCALSKFKDGPQAEFEKTLSGLCSPSGSPLQMQPAQPFLMTNGTKMPPTHSLASLLDYLKANIKGTTHRDHDVRSVSKEMEMWFPRESEYSQYINLDAANPQRYTRNVVFHNEYMDVLLMCWPAGSMSTIHDHEESSCWVALAEGTVHEVQYAMPRFDMKFIEAEKKDPATATGHCGPLKVLATAQLVEGGAQATYANNEIGLHRVENRSGKLACTLHVYAPPLTRMRIFTEEGHVHVHKSTCTMPDCGTMGCEQREGPFDMEAWNNTPIAQCTRHYSSVDSLKSPMMMPATPTPTV